MKKIWIVIGSILAGIVGTLVYLANRDKVWTNTRARQTVLRKHDSEFRTYREGQAILEKYAAEVRHLERLYENEHQKETIDRYKEAFGAKSTD
jgi:hypothetical protein